MYRRAYLSLTMDGLPLVGGVINDRMVVLVQMVMCGHVHGLGLKSHERGSVVNSLDGWLVCPFVSWFFVGPLWAKIHNGLMLSRQWRGRYRVRAMLLFFLCLRCPM